MDKDKIERLIEVHKDKSTEELKSIVLERNVEEWDIEALEAMEQILESRGIQLEIDLSPTTIEPPTYMWDIEQIREQWRSSLIYYIWAFFIGFFIFLLEEYYNNGVSIAWYAISLLCMYLSMVRLWYCMDVFNYDNTTKWTYVLFISLCVGCIGIPLYIMLGIRINRAIKKRAMEEAQIT
jgi:hypothetical protein